MPPAKKRAGRSSEASFVRSLTGQGAKRSPAEHGERAANGLVKPRDPDKERLVIPGGGSVTLTRPIPEAKKELLARLKGLSVREAWARKVQEWIENGTLDGILDKLARLALNGDREAMKEILDRAMGKATQNIAVAAEVRVRLSDEDRAVLTGIKSLFGMTQTGAPVVADAEAKEVA